MTDRTQAYRLTHAQRELLLDESCDMADPAQVDAWTEATGLDMAHRAVARLLALTELDADGELLRHAQIDSIECTGWEQGEDAKYSHRDRTTQGIKFSHSRHTITLEIRGSVTTTDHVAQGNLDGVQLVVQVQAERLGQNGQIRNARVTLGYRVGGEYGTDTFLACDDSPNARSVAIYRALGATAQADDMQRQLDSHARYLANARARHGLR